MGKVMIEGFQCERCKHIWTPRSKIEGIPTICPKCKSPYWNKPKIRTRNILKSNIQGGDDINE